MGISSGISIDSNFPSKIKINTVPEAFVSGFSVSHQYAGFTEVLTSVFSCLCLSLSSHTLRCAWPIALA